MITTQFWFIPQFVFRKMEVIDCVTCLCEIGSDIKMQIILHTLFVFTIHFWCAVKCSIFKRDLLQCAVFDITMFSSTIKAAGRQLTAHMCSETFCTVMECIALCTVQCAVYNVQCTMCTVMECTLHCALCSALCNAVCTMCSVLCTVQCKLQ